jgi:hypothetical protein
VDSGHLAAVVHEVAEDDVAQRLVGVLGDRPDFSDVFLAKTSRDHVDEPAAKHRQTKAHRSRITGPSGQGSTSPEGRQIGSPEPWLGAFRWAASHAPAAFVKTITR